MPSLKARPSKTYFHRLFESDIASLHGDWGVDIACATWKNRRLFRTRHYVGVDIRLDSICKGRESMRGDGYGVVSDILAPGLKRKAFDVVVCTHTLVHLPQERRLEAVKQLITLLRPDGCLIFNIPCEDRKSEQQILDLMKGTFVSVKAIRYGNVLSQLYEHYHTTPNEGLTFIDGPPGVIHRAWIIFFAALEYLPLLHYTGKTLYVRAARAKGS